MVDSGQTTYEEVKDTSIQKMGSDWYRPTTSSWGDTSVSVLDDEGKLISVNDPTIKSHEGPAVLRVTSTKRNSTLLPWASFTKQSDKTILIPVKG